jgi:hypothetical protein
MGRNCAPSDRTSSLAHLVDCHRKPPRTDLEFFIGDANHVTAEKQATSVFALFNRRLHRKVRPLECFADTSNFQFEFILVVSELAMFSFAGR